MVSTGLNYLDKISGGLRQGDNVVWEISEEIPLNHFINLFFQHNSDFKKNIIYINFNYSPQTITKRYSKLFKNHRVILIDAFTNGKGNSDPVFQDFYIDLTEKEKKQFICAEDPRDLKSFLEILNTVENENRDGSFYIFDSLTGMNELLKNESAVLDFFAFTCPKLYDLNTLAYWSLINTAHSKEFIAGLTHITQVVFSLRRAEGENFELYIKKMQGRESKQSKTPVKFRFRDDNIEFETAQDSITVSIGNNVRSLRKQLHMTQSALAQEMGITSGALSQIESGQIAPSLQTLILLSEKLGKSLESLVGTAETGLDSAPAVSTAKTVISNKNYSLLKLSEYPVEDMVSPYLITVKGNRQVKGPIILHKGTEFISVLEGSITVYLEHDSVKLSAGESFTINKTFITQVKNEENADARLLYILL